MAKQTSLSLASHVSSPSIARAAARGFLTGCNLDQLIEDTSLLVSELVTNAVLHGGSDIDLRMAADETTLRVEVFDTSERLAAVRNPGTDDEFGRGLHLVDALAKHWGSDRCAGGKVTWFSLNAVTQHQLGTH